MSPRSTFRNCGSSSRWVGRRRRPTRVTRGSSARSEEHTSELQSPCNLVCRLLLEKKKKRTQPTTVHPLCYNDQRQRTRRTKCGGRRAIRTVRHDGISQLCSTSSRSDLTVLEPVQV